MIKASELPRSYEEFAQRKEWAGKVAIDGTDFEWLKGMSASSTARPRRRRLIKAIVATLKPVVTDGHLALARSVGAGEYWLSLNNYVMLSTNVKLAGGADRDLPARSGGRCSSAEVAVNAKAPNPNAARLAANFMLSQEGQGHLAKFGRLPTRSDVRVQSARHRRAAASRRRWSPTLFKAEDERKWQQTFNALFKPR